MSKPVKQRRHIGSFGCLLIVFCLPIVLLVVLAGVYVLWRNHMAKKVEAELAELREAGYPVCTADLDWYYEYPPKEKDCTELWLDAFAVLDTPQYRADSEHLPIVGDDETSIPRPGEPWGNLDKVEAFLAKYQPVLDRLHQAAEAGGAARYPLDCRQVDLLLPDVTRVRNATRLLLCEAAVHVHRRNWKDGLRSVRAILRLAASLERKPILVTQIVRMYCHNLGLQPLGRLVVGSGVPDDVLRAMQAELLAVDFDPEVEKAMIGERAVMLSMLRRPDVLLKYGPVGGDASAGRLARFLPREDNQLKYLEFMKQLIQASRLRGAKRFKAGQKCAAEIDDFFGQAGKIGRMRYSFVDVSLFGVDPFFTVVAKSEAQTRTAATWIAVERFRRQHKRLPKNLAELVPEFLGDIPEDPFDGNPLRYVVRDGEPVVYSVGPNQTDDGGINGQYEYPLDDDRMWEDSRDDVVFPIPEPKPPAVEGNVEEDTVEKDKEEAWETEQ